MTAIQYDLAAPSGAERLPEPTDDGRGFDLRSRVWQTIRDGRDLREVGS